MQDPAEYYMNTLVPMVVEQTSRGERAYDIVIGPGVLAETGTYLATLAPGTRCAVVTDENVAALHLDAVRASLSGAGFEPGTLVLPAGEATKDFGHLRRVDHEWHAAFTIVFHRKQLTLTLKA